MEGQVRNIHATGCQDSRRLSFPETFASYPLEWVWHRYYFKVYILGNFIYKYSIYVILSPLSFLQLSPVSLTLQIRHFLYFHIYLYLSIICVYIYISYVFRADLLELANLSEDSSLEKFLLLKLFQTWTILLVS